MPRIDRSSIQFTHPGEEERSCALGWLGGARCYEAQRRCADEKIGWLREHLDNRDWYAIERIARQLQQCDPDRAFDAIDLCNLEHSLR